MKFSISTERLLHRKFIIKSRVVVKVCFRTLVKSFFDTLKLLESFGSKISDFITEKISSGVFLHDNNYLITI